MADIIPCQALLSPPHLGPSAGRLGLLPGHGRVPSPQHWGRRGPAAGTLSLCSQALLCRPQGLGACCSEKAQRGLGLLCPALGCREDSLDVGIP